MTCTIPAHGEPCLPMQWPHQERGTTCRLVQVRADAAAQSKDVQAIPSWGLPGAPSRTQRQGQTHF